MVRTQAVSRQGEGGPRSGGRGFEDEAGLTSTLEMAYNEGRKKRADHYDGRHGKSFFDCIATIYLMTIRCCRSRMVFCVAGIFGGKADVDSVTINIVLYTAVYLICISGAVYQSSD